MGFQTDLKKTSYQIIFHDFGVSEKDVCIVESEQSLCTGKSYSTLGSSMCIHHISTQVIILKIA